MDWETFFKHANYAGVNARWTTRLETKRLTKDYRQDLSFRRDGRTPVFERDGAECGIMGGIVTRIAYEGLSPSSLLTIVQDTISAQAYLNEGSEEPTS